MAASAIHDADVSAMAVLVAGLVLVLRFAVTRDCARVGGAARGSDAVQHPYTFGCGNGNDRRSAIDDLCHVYGATCWIDRFAGNAQTKSSRLDAGFTGTWIAGRLGANLYRNRDLNMANHGVEKRRIWST